MGRIACNTTLGVWAAERVEAKIDPTTVQMNTSFLRPVAGGSGQASVIARVLRMGKRLVFGEIEVLDAGAKLAAHSTTIYALL